MRINLTQHEATPEQECLERSEEQAKNIEVLLTFEELPTLEEISRRACSLTDVAVASGATEAMIGGAPYLILALDPALRLRGITPVYTFSLRESVEITQKNGSVVKTSRFRHLGFVRF